MTPRNRVRALLAGQPTDRLPVMPVTMMLAADQIGRPYGEYARDHRVMADAQLRTAERFGFDHVSVISDPAREAADCGARICFFADQPPAVDEEHALLADPSTLSRLRPPDPLGGGRMHDRVRGVARLRERGGGRFLVEGWIEGPCAEGADLRGINTLMLDFFDRPGFVRELFAFVVELELAFARAQVEAGADLIGLGDAAASLVGPALYEEFVWPGEKRLVDGIHALGVPVRLHICGNTTDLLPAIARLGCDIVDLDSMVSLDEARRRLGPGPVLLGNIDPVRVLRYGSPAGIEEALAACHRAAGPRYIVGAGCEIPRGTPDENVFALARFARRARSA
jgi:MtaA/CmuA family methyltransferase